MAPRTRFGYYYIISILRLHPRRSSQILTLGILMLIVSEGLYEQKATVCLFPQLDSENMQGQSNNTFTFAGVFLTSRRHCLLTYPYPAVDTCFGLQNLC